MSAFLFAGCSFLFIIMARSYSGQISHSSCYVSAGDANVPANAITYLSQALYKPVAEDFADSEEREILEAHSYSVE